MLTLKNFKSFTDLSIIIQPGLTLLDGRSGVGKSTILDAISFVLYNTGKTGIYPRGGGKSSTSVELKIGEVTLFRQRRPNLFKVIRGKETLIDAEAEGWVEREFGNQGLWRTGGYIKQGEDCGFIVMSGKERMEFLKSLSQSETVDSMMFRVNKKIGEMKDSLRENKSNVNAYHSLYMKRYNSMTEEEMDVEEWSEEQVKFLADKYGCSQDLDEIEKYGIKHLNSSLRKVLTEIGDLKVELDRSIETEKRRDEITARLVELEKELNLTSSLQTIESRLTEISDSMKRTEEWKRVNSLTERRDRVKSKIGEVESSAWSEVELKSIKECQQLGNIRERLSEVRGKIEGLEENKRWKERCKVEEEINSLKDELVGLPIESRGEELAKASIASKRLSCPTCSTSLFLCSDGLKEYSEGVMNEEEFKELKEHERLWKRGESMRMKLGILEESLAEFVDMRPPVEVKENARELERLRFKLESGLEKIASLPQNYLEIDVDAELERILESQRSREAERELKSIESLLSDMKLEERSAHDETELRREEIELKKDMDRVKRIRNEIERLGSELGSLQVIDSEPIKKRLSKRERRAAKLDEILDSFSEDISLQKRLTELYDLYDQHADMLKERETISSMLGRYEKIKESLITGEYIIMDELLGEVNEVLEEILSRLFNEPISVIFHSLRRLKTVDRIKNEVNMMMDYKGSELTKLSELSGGERSRVNLALTIAFSKLSNSPFLLLDECMSSLDVDTKEHVIPAIREHLGKNTLVVNHDTTEGVYDNVLRIGE